MRRVVPSQVVAFIDDVFPWAQTQVQGVGVNLTRERSTVLSGLLDLLEKMPEELLTMNANEFSSFTCSAAAIRDRLALWRAQGAPGLELVTVPGLLALSPVRLIRDALVNCSDVSAAPTTNALNFITDAGLRADLRNDIGVIDRTLSNGEWKAATVLAGSVIEALLLWSIQQRPGAQVTGAVAALVGNGTFAAQPPTNLERWDLHHFIEVAANLTIISGETAIQSRLAKAFRNLIHPGRSQRLGQKCDRATALSAIAGVEHVVRDLTP